MKTALDFYARGKQKRRTQMSMTALDIIVEIDLFVRNVERLFIKRKQI